MNELLRAIAHADDGLFTAAQAARCGLDHPTLRTMVRDGVCLRLRRGLYVFSDLWPTHPSERHTLLARGILCQHQHRIAASHHTAVLLAGLPTWGVPYSTPRFVRHTGVHTTSRPAVSVGRRWPAAAYSRRRELPILRPAVAALQVAMSSGVEQAVVVLDAGLRDGHFEREDLADWLSRLSGYRHCTRARAAVEICDALSESPGESRLRVRLHYLGYTALQSQVMVHADGRIVGRVDLYDPVRRIAIEFDGLLKYEGPGGRDALVAEKLREDRLRLAGLGVARFGWADLDRTDVLRQKVERAARSAASTTLVGQREPTVAAGVS